jgi:hypothetical protein
MAIVRPIWLTNVGIVVVGYVLATLRPHQWWVGELVLLAAGNTLLRERNVLVDDFAQPCHHGASDSFSASGAGWAGSSGASLREDPPIFHAPQFEQTTYRPPQPATASNMQVQEERGPVKSVEQIAHEMLTQAFRQA